MPMLPARDYVSEHTLFIRDLIDKKPELRAKQREGRAKWWDKTPADLNEGQQMDEGRVAMLPYVYQTK